MKKSIENYCQELKSEVDAQLLFIKAEQDNDVRRAKESYNYLVKINLRLKEYLNRYRFLSHGEEITFFKMLKPQLVWPLIYYNQVYKIEKGIPDGGYVSLPVIRPIKSDKIVNFKNKVDYEKNKIYRNTDC